MSENSQDWRQRNPVGRPKKVDHDGNPIYRVPTSIYLDIRMKEWLVKKTGNLSEWIEKMIYKAHQNDYCFWCFDDNIKEVHHGWVCRNERHRNLAGRGAPSVVLEYKQCAFCDSSFENNMPVIVDNTEKGGSGDSNLIMCGFCADKHKLEESMEEDGPE